MRVDCNGRIATILLMLIMLSGCSHREHSEYTDSYSDTTREWCDNCNKKHNKRGK